MTVQGYDISIWNDEDSTPQHVNPLVGRNAGAFWCGIKTSQADYADPDFMINWNLFKPVMHRLGYHFMDWTRTPMVQAAFFAGLLKNDPGELYPTIDYECRTGIAAPSPTSRSYAVAQLKVLMQEVEQRLGRMTQVYTSPSYWKDYGDPEDPFFKDRPLFIANYGVNIPEVPPPWDNWKFWQYTATGPGLVYGCESKGVDLDYYSGDMTHFIAEFGPLPVQPPVPPVAEGLRFEVINPSGLNIRSAPVIGNNVIGGLTMGSVIEVASIQDFGGSQIWLQLAPGKWAALKYGNRFYMELAG